MLDGLVVSVLIWADYVRKTKRNIEAFKAFKVRTVYK